MSFQTRMTLILQRNPKEEIVKKVQAALFHAIKMYLDWMWIKWLLCDRLFFCIIIYS